MSNKETIDEAAERYAEGKSSNFTFRTTHIRDFSAGAKWQAKTMYSEEEVQVKLYECLGHFAQKHNIIINGNEIDQWFNKHKKQ
jgi:hypothetical protein